ncbi:MAG: four helix bundle protein [Opitutaceae bacterium]|jgi:four helix bundle protein|nr:four helix bundle protein [Opitutaceae bacterium]
MFHKEGDLRKRTFQFGRRIARLYLALPPKRLADKLSCLAEIYGNQLVRAANSIGSNYRESQRGRSVAEYKAKLGDCLREADETLHWLECIEEDGILDAKRLSDIKNECTQLIAIFVSLLK